MGVLNNLCHTLFHTLPQIAASIFLNTMAEFLSGSCLTCTMDLSSCRSHARACMFKKFVPVLTDSTSSPIVLGHALWLISRMIPVFLAACRQNDTGQLLT